MDEMNLETAVSSQAGGATGCSSRSFESGATNLGRFPLLTRPPNSSIKHGRSEQEAISDVPDGLQPDGRALASSWHVCAASTFTRVYFCLLIGGGQKPFIRI